MYLINLLENIQVFSVVVLAFCSIFYYIQLLKIKRDRKHSIFEAGMFIIWQVAFVLLAITGLLRLLVS